MFGCSVSDLSFFILSYVDWIMEHIDTKPSIWGVDSRKWILLYYVLRWFYLTDAMAKVRLIWPSYILWKVCVCCIRHVVSYAMFDQFCDDVNNNCEQERWQHRLLNYPHFKLLMNPLIWPEIWQIDIIFNFCFCSLMTHHCPLMTLDCPPMIHHCHPLMIHHYPHDS